MEQPAAASTRMSGGKTEEPSGRAEPLCLSQNPLKNGSVGVSSSSCNLGC